MTPGKCYVYDVISLNTVSSEQWSTPGSWIFNLCGLGIYLLTYWLTYRAENRTL